VLSHKYTIESLVLSRKARMNNQLFASLITMRRSLPTHFKQIATDSTCVNANLRTRGHFAMSLERAFRGETISVKPLVE